MLDARSAVALAVGVRLAAPLPPRAPRPLPRGVAVRLAVEPAERPVRAAAAGALLDVVRAALDGAAPPARGARARAGRLPLQPARRRAVAAAARRAQPGLRQRQDARDPDRLARTPLRGLDPNAQPSRSASPPGSATHAAQQISTGPGSFRHSRARDRPPHRTAPTPHRTAPHRTAPAWRRPRCASSGTCCRTSST